ncbi:hypothetical protein BDK51DRAFT_38043 [Blyttiomyces helicus]|uniref:Uncharacterized protein n=1 Tax=Blyttiomyces helicus TaxID=388810 RepID=A0A4V1IQL4_9FUNG|nr:hypothetical protein BDK51DRAFT_38043 [Blyttiomyces helicus]|eukprot:RKO86967.1 hypothetical protein BDK51DRAFT_38043 [Blyttiomyces helicus]
MGGGDIFDLRSRSVLPLDSVVSTGSLSDEGKGPGSAAAPHLGPVLGHRQSVTRGSRGADAFAVLLLPQTLLPHLDPSFMSSGVGFAFCLVGFNLGASLLGRTSEELTEKLAVITKCGEGLCGFVCVYEGVGHTNAMDPRSSSHFDPMKEFDTGRVLNMINVDAPSVGNCVRTCNLVWSAPVQIAVSLVLLNNLIGVGTWAGFGVVVVAFGIQGAITPNGGKSGWR